MANSPVRSALILVSALALVAPAAWADDDVEDDFTREGFYLTLQGVSALPAENLELRSAPAEFGVNVAGGWRFYQNFATEVEMEYIPDLAKGDIELRTFGTSFNLRAYPLARLGEPDSWLQRIQPFFKGGFGWQWTQRRGRGLPNQDDGGFAGRLGGGLDIYLTRNLVLTGSATYQLSTGDTRDVRLTATGSKRDTRYLSVGWGLTYRFGDD
jgi:hypothetical protein